MNSHANEITFEKVTIFNLLIAKVMDITDQASSTFALFQEMLVNLLEASVKISNEFQMCNIKLVLAN